MSDVFPELPSKTGEPAWEAAYLLPPQGRWSEEDFLKFHTTQMAELVNGRLEILPMPNIKHQRMLVWLLDLIRESVKAETGGLTLIAPLPTKLFPGTIREPDLLYISPENLPGPEVEYPSRIDLAIEIVSDGTRRAHKRDYEDKRVDYAKAGIAEYWIVDPKEQTVTVLVLADNVYIDHGCFTLGQIATGKLLPGLSVDVQTLMSV